MAPRAGVLPGFSGREAGRLGRAPLPFASARAPEAPAHGDHHGRPHSRGGVALRPRAVCAPRRWRARRASSLHAPPRRLVPVGAPRLQLDAEPGHRELRTPQSAPPNRVGGKASRWRGLDGSATARGERPARRGHKLPGRVSQQKTWETYGAHGRSGCFPETMTVLEEGGTLRMVLGSSASGTRREASLTRWAGVWHHGALCPIYLEFLDDPQYAKGAGDKPRAQRSLGQGGKAREGGARQRRSWNRGPAQARLLLPVRRAAGRGARPGPRSPPGAHGAHGGPGAGAERDRYQGWVVEPLAPCLHPSSAGW